MTAADMTPTALEPTPSHEIEHGGSDTEATLSLGLFDDTTLDEHIEATPPPARSISWRKKRPEPARDRLFSWTAPATS